MELSRQDREVLEQLGRALAEGDPALAVELGVGGRRPRERRWALSLAAAWVLFVAGVAVVTGYRTNGPLVGLGCILVVLGLSIAAAWVPVRLSSYRC
jgi:uncharacterized membrane protein YphA (DoxX/SURF4 family)